METETLPVPGVSAAKSSAAISNAPGLAREALNNRYVYVVVSPRAHGLSVGVNMNPDKRCNFDCVYCEVARSGFETPHDLNCDAMDVELTRTLALIQAGGLMDHPAYRHVPRELLKLKHVALSGDGEPTLARNFLEIVETVAHVRALSKLPFYKLVLITNGSHLHEPTVQDGLKLFTAQDEIWIKLDVGNPQDLEHINRTDVPFERILANIKLVGRDRPIVIQSMFALVDRHPPTGEQIDAFSQRLVELRNAGAKITLVQIYSPNRPCPHPGVEHLPLRNLSLIAQAVRQATGLKVEVY